MDHTIAIVDAFPEGLGLLALLAFTVFMALVYWLGLILVWREGKQEFARWSKRRRRVAIFLTLTVWVVTLVAMETGKLLYVFLPIVGLGAVWAVVGVPIWVWRESRSNRRRLQAAQRSEQ